MIPIEEVKLKLPKDALALFDETFSPAIVNKLLLSFRMKRNTTFRINTLKADRSSVLPELAKEGFKVKNVHFLSDAYQLDTACDGKLLKTALAEEGKIYLQSLSSQIPAFVLEPKENENILDMAASPGSKTTQITAMMRNTGSIDAVEPDFVRMERLMFNAKTLGASNISFFKTDGVDFCNDKQGIYDRILADVPCSGEGRFSIHDRNSYSRWKLSQTDKLATLQKKLLRSAILSVKPGGIVVYSTCTLNVTENEKNIDWALNQTDFKIKILPVNEKFKALSDSIEPVLNLGMKSVTPGSKTVYGYYHRKPLKVFLYAGCSVFCDQEPNEKR